MKNIANSFTSMDHPTKQTTQVKMQRRRQSQAQIRSDFAGTLLSKIEFVLELDFYYALDESSIKSAIWVLLVGGRAGF